MPTIDEGADWLELSCFLNYPSPIPETIIKAYISTVAEDLLELEQNDEECRIEYISETFLADIIKLMKWRERVMAPHYPFVFSNDNIGDKEDILDSLEYS